MTWAASPFLPVFIGAVGDQGAQIAKACGLLASRPSRLQAPGPLSLGPTRPDVTVPCLAATSTSVLPFPPFKAEFKPLLVMRECFWIHVFIWQTFPEPWSSGWGHSDELHSALPACPSEPGRDAEKST